MKNFIFLSPNFPTNYWMFCRELKKNGLNVLGIGDQPYDELYYELKDSLTEYYKVDSLEDYDQVYRAVAFFIHKYGRIDWLESNNEYWLEQNARLRSDFNITSGFQIQDIPRIKYKSQMKAYYQKAGIPTARYHLADTLKNSKVFAKEVGYPIIAKPDNGVGASDTHRITSDRELGKFFRTKLPNVTYILEEYIEGEINSYDAIIDSNGNPIFEGGNVTPHSIMDIVNNREDCFFYIQKKLPADVRKAGRATVKSFGVKSRFVHFEFFRLLKDHEGLGKEGAIVALEVNMRPSGGFSPDMLNFSRDTNVYKIWADMIAFDHSTIEEGEPKFCAYVGLRDEKQYALTQAKIIKKYGEHLKMIERLPAALAGAMGDQIYVATFGTPRSMEAFHRQLTKLKEVKPVKKDKKKK